MRRAFTLVELLVVIAIMGILVALLPQLREQVDYSDQCGRDTVAW
jgi:prepilin-type N-terminal cleavage/methylation domain-containing protein